MITEGLGKIESQPTRNEEGTLIYFQTTNNLGVHIEVDTGDVLSVEDLKSGMVIHSEGTNHIDFKPMTMTLEEAISDKILVAVNTKDSSRLVGTIASIDRGFPRWSDEPPITEVKIILTNGGEATVYGETITNIVRMI